MLICVCVSWVLLFSLLSFAEAKHDSVGSSHHRFAVRRVKSLDILPPEEHHGALALHPSSSFSQSDVEQRGFVGDVTQMIEGIPVDLARIMGKVIEEGVRMPLKYVPQKETTVSRHEFLKFKSVKYSSSTGTKYRLKPSRGEFRLSIKVGEVTLEPLADTGSADLVIDSKAIKYKPNASTSIGKTFDEAYTGGEHAKGTIHRETVLIGGIQLENQAVGKVEKGSLIPEELQPPPDGVLGLGFEGQSSFSNDYSSREVDPFVVRAAKSGLLKQFAFDLETTGGFIDFNEGVKPNGARFIPISEKGWWAVKGSINGIGMDGGAVIDSGTELMFGPAHIVNRILKATGAPLVKDSMGNWAARVDCNKGIELKFNFGGGEIVVSGAASLQKTDGGKCISSLIGQVDSDGSFIIGQPLFYHAYITFNPVKRAISFQSKA